MENNGSFRGLQKVSLVLQLRRCPPQHNSGNERAHRECFGELPREFSGKTLPSEHAASFFGLYGQPRPIDLCQHHPRNEPRDQHVCAVWRFQGEPARKGGCSLQHPKCRRYRTAGECYKAQRHRWNLRRGTNRVRLVRKVRNPKAEPVSPDFHAGPWLPRQKISAKKPAWGDSMKSLKAKPVHGLSHAHRELQKMKINTEHKSKRVLIGQCEPWTPRLELKPRRARTRVLLVSCVYLGAIHLQNRKNDK